ncbi:MAG: histidinol-phosphatase [Gemmatimonadetes bacterium]|nr:histidinol-phosphatase [Gemmatimonadota bacterium]MDE3256555.1 histidinol-phosphatase [Gemmatimonadota bacterium]
MAEPSLQDLLAFSTNAAWQAGRITLRYFQSGVRVETKSDDSPVTEADRKAERRIAGLIQDRFPEDAIVGEEFGDRTGRTPRRWIIDPIDGTKSFVHGVPLYGVMICVEIDGVPSVGVVHLPAMNEMVCAARGSGCTWNGRPASVSTVSRLEDALLCATDFESFAEFGRDGAYRNLAGRVAYCRGWGDCYGHVLVATGRAEIMLDPVMAVWDCAALQPILEEAGGTFTDWSGNPTIRGGNAISTNGVLFDEVIRSIA